MASSSRTSKSKRGRTASNVQEPPRPVLHPPPTFSFASPKQETRYHVLVRKHLCAQKFVHLPTLRELCILPQIRTLFRNIGWEGVLDLHALSYTQPTLEVLSSIEFNKRANILSFRLFDRACIVHVDELCQLVNAPTENVGVYFRTMESYGIRNQFWESITGIKEYNSSSAKASRIIHPALRVAHRIICSIFFAQEETSKCGTRELELLHAMVHCPPQRPHFGHYFIDKLLKVANRNDGQIHCGGLITLLGLLPSVNARFSNDLDVIRGETQLRSSIFVNMHMIRKDGPTIIWQVERQEYLSIDSQNKKLLKLASPTSAINWRIPSNMGARLVVSTREDMDVDEEDDEGDSDEEEEEGQDAPEIPQHFPQRNTGSPEYDDPYLAEFSRIRHSIQDLRDDFSVYQTDLENFGTVQADLDMQFYDFSQEQRAHNASVDAYMAEQRAHNAAMMSMLGGFRNVHIGSPPPPQSHQYPPNPPPPGTQPFQGPFPQYPSYPQYPRPPRDP